MALLVAIHILLTSGIVSPHLEHVPSLGTLTTRSLAGGDLEVLGWHADWALDAELLALSTLDELGADLLQRLHLARSQGDADLVDLWGIEEPPFFASWKDMSAVLSDGVVVGVVVGVRCGLRSRLWYR